MVSASPERRYSVQELRSLFLSWIEDEKKSAAEYKKMYDSTHRAEFLQMSNDEHKHAQYLKTTLTDIDLKMGRQPQTGMKWYPQKGEPGTDYRMMKPSKIPGILLYYVRSEGGYTERIIKDMQGGYNLIGDDGNSFDVLPFDSLKQLQDFHHIANSNLRKP